MTMHVSVVIYYKYSWTYGFKADAHVSLYVHARALRMCRLRCVPALKLYVLHIEAESKRPVIKSSYKGAMQLAGVSFAFKR